MIDIKAIAQEYDCRHEVEEVLGAPKLRTPKSWAWCCPFHHDDSPSFHAYTSHYFCFGCQAHGDVLDWWAWSRNVPLAQIIKENTVRQLTPEERQRIATQQAERAAKELQEKIEQAQKALEELKKAQAWVRYHDNLTDETRVLWRSRGIPDEWQNFWKLGYTPACPTYRQSDSLTIPVIFPLETEPRNIRHRLLHPSDPHDKYRPEQSGLPAVPFYADPDLPIERAERVIVVEGEIKSQVTFLTLDEPLWQVVGIPGKAVFETITEVLKGHDNVWVIPDPGAGDVWTEKARQIKARVVNFGYKIDDAIVEYGLDKHWLKGLLQSGKKVS